MRPNVLLIQADQFRFDCFGAAGNGDVHTPHLDRLAAEGVRYTNAFTPFPVCTPSRYSMLTGLHARQHGGNTNRSTLAPGIDTFPKALRRAGYRTAAVGKMHFTPTYLDTGYDHVELAEQDGPGRYEDDYHRELTDAGLAPVIDLIDQEREYRSQAPESYWRTYGSGRSDLPEEWHSTTWIGERARGVLNGWSSDGGQLLHVSFIKPHHPFDPPAPWDGLYDPDALTPLPGWTDAIPPLDLPHRHEYFDYGRLDLPTLRRVMAGYYATITQLDHHIGRMLDLLRQRGLYDDTLIIFTSDHGEYLGFHHLLLKDGPMYDPLVRVPLLLKFPSGTRGGQTLDALVSLIDVAPTVLAAAGCAMRTPPAGVDLADPGAGHRYVFAEDNRNGPAYMARSASHKLLVSSHPGRDAYFDLAGDPYELRNRIAEPEPELREALTRWALFDAATPAYVDGDAPQIGTGARSALPRGCFDAAVAKALNT